jgi:hypothetical protein
VKALVTTPHFILECDLESGRTEVLDSGAGEYYGLTWSPDGTRLALSTSGVDNAGLESLESYVNSELGCLVVGGEPSWPFLSVPHQIEWVDDDAILATNTGRNALARYNAGDGSIVLHRYCDSLWDRVTAAGREGMHLNSVTRRGERVYLVAHNFDKGSSVLELAWPSLAKVAEHPIARTGVHNFWAESADHWLVCASNEGELADARTGKTVWSNARQGYTRGLAAHGDTVVVGHSERTGSRHLRTASETGVWLLDRSTWRTIEFLPLGYFGGVHEVRIYDVPDECHHGGVLLPEALSVLGRQRSQLRRERLERAARTILPVADWELAAGEETPDVAESGAIGMPDGAFALVLRRGASLHAGSVKGVLHVRGENEADFACLVARHRGPADRHQVAALFQVVRGTLTAGLWANDGEWRLLADRAFAPVEWRAWCEPGPTPRLAVRLDFAGDRLSLVVAGRATFAATLPSGTAAKLGSALGLRIRGSSLAISALEWAE